MRGEVRYWGPLAGLILMGLLAGCEPGGSVSQERYEYHKSNREAYLYQGL